MNYWYTSSIPYYCYSLLTVNFIVEKIKKKGENFIVYTVNFIVENSILFYHFF